MRVIGVLLECCMLVFVGAKAYLPMACISAKAEQTCSMRKNKVSSHCMHHMPSKKADSPKPLVCTDCPMFATIDFHAHEFSLGLLIIGKQEFAVFPCPGQQSYHRLPWNPPDPGIPIKI